MIRGRGIIYPKRNPYHMAARFRMRQLGESYLEARRAIIMILMDLERTNQQRAR